MFDLQSTLVTFAIISIAVGLGFNIVTGRMFAPRLGMIPITIGGFALMAHMSITLLVEFEHDKGSTLIDTSSTIFDSYRPPIIEKVQPLGPYISSETTRQFLKRSLTRVETENGVFSVYGTPMLNKEDIFYKIEFNYGSSKVCKDQEGADCLQLARS